MQNNDLISRAAAIDALTDQNLRRNVDSVCDGDMNRTRRAAHRVIAQLPAADAELERQGYVRVTRCRDCKRWEYDLDLATIGKGTCLNSLLWTEPNDYCSRGERTDSHTCGPDTARSEAKMVQDNDLISRADSISRSALLAAYDAAHKGPPGGARKLIEEAPGLDVAPVVHGTWGRYYDEYHCTEYIVCSNCGAKYDSDIVFAYQNGESRLELEGLERCPHCGAKMEAIQNDNTFSK